MLALPGLLLLLEMQVLCWSVTVQAVVVETPWHVPCRHYHALPTAHQSALDAPQVSCDVLLRTVGATASVCWKTAGGMGPITTSVYYLESHLTY